MKKLSYLLALAVTVFVSCKKEVIKNPPPPGNTPAENIEKFVKEDEFIQFAYNDDDVVTKVTVKNEFFTSGAETDFIVSYNEDNTIKELTGDNGQKIIPVYDNHVLVRADVFAEGERTAYTAYYYENNKLSMATIYVMGDEDFLPFFEYRFSYNNAGNISESIVMVATETPNYLVRAGSATMEYDTHQNPLYKHNDLLVLFWQNASKNNVTVENHFDAELNQENKYVYTYNYHENGLPESAVIKKGLPGSPQTTSNVNYVYN